MTDLLHISTGPESGSYITTKKTNDMKTDIHTFEKLVYNLWAEDRHKYGSMQFPAREALEKMKSEGIENAQEMYDEFYQQNKSRFHYAGD